tara:strand:- start:181 stop:426 length:246 start_codon:yes stop_codon:yes gene_type:complete
MSWNFPLLKRWNFPIIRKLQNVYREKGLGKLLLWIIFIVIGTKVVIINGFIALCNFLFGVGWEFAPVGKWIANKILYLGVM